MQRTWHLAHGRTLGLGPRCLVMGILNVTPDSFSDGGRFADRASALAQARRMIGEGADIVDVGGESTRPGADPLSPEEEQARVLPVIEDLAAESEIVISVDTYRAETARRALQAGAHIVNDVHGLQKDEKIASLAAEWGAGLAVMHTGRDRKKLADPIDDQIHFLTRSLKIARSAKVEDNRIVLDPGFGFAKNAVENLAIVARFEELRQLGFPFLVGTSRKRFVGSVTGRDGDVRDIGTAATSAILRMKGADIVRVHNVAVNIDAVRMADAVLAHRGENADTSVSEDA